MFTVNQLLFTCKNFTWSARVMFHIFLPQTRHHEMTLVNYIIYILIAKIICCKPCILTPVICNKNSSGRKIGLSYSYYFWGKDLFKQSAGSKTSNPPPKKKDI